MGKKKKAIRVVLDTNVLLSALLFGGNLARMVGLWKEGRIAPVFSRETFQEFSAALKYPKFSLSKDEIKTIIEEEILPYCDVTDVTEDTEGVCSDPDDDKFISCAISASADFLVSGDKALIALKKYKSVRILKPSDFLDLVVSLK
ncbi:MAG: putative toxin-antitoxin system toxin component, PIN family [Dehalococcoidia bacterium]|nr:MAG: putative toxin-antitoxin system toxin component, PIN family [Dehalococcoidia bacterium]